MHRKETVNNYTRGFKKRAELCETEEREGDKVCSQLLLFSDEIPVVNPNETDNKKDYSRNDYNLLQTADTRFRWLL